MAIQRDFKGNSLLIATDDYVVVDLETTGISPARDRIIEIGAVRVEHGTVTAEYSKLVNPGRPVGGFITGLTGISDEMVGNASPIEAVLPDFLAHLRPSDTIVAHNAIRYQLPVRQLHAHARQAVFIRFHRYAAVEPCTVPTGASAPTGGPDPTLRHRRRGGAPRLERCPTDRGMLRAHETAAGESLRATDIPEAREPAKCRVPRLLHSHIRCGYTAHTCRYRKYESLQI